MQQKTITTLLACLFVVYGYLAINMGLPAYPLLIRYFKTNASHVKLSLTVFLFTFAFAQVFWGVIADRFGRRRVILVATTISIVGSLLTALSTSITLFILGRFVEALGVGYASMMARALLVDSLKDKALQIGMSYMVTIAATIPFVGPIIGGQLLHFINWQAIYITLALIGIGFILYAAFFFHDTLTQRIEKLSLKSVFRVYAEIFSHQQYTGYLVSYTFMLSGLVTFYAISPFIFIKHLQIPAHQYGFILMTVGLSYMGGSILARRLTRHFSKHKLFLLGYGFTLLSLGLLICFLAFYHMTAITVILPMMLYAISCGLISPTANAGGLSALVQHKGSGAALFGSSVMALSSLLTALLALVHLNSLMPLTLLLSSLLFFSVITYRLLVR